VSKYRIPNDEHIDNAESVLTDLMFENLAYDKLIYIMDVLEEYDELAATIDEILQLIDSEIDTT